jgi:oxepin-CoA hydrolase/3-oxo-5,6-dehydrosuberyl-CoA semialdehyde dehydrogenase
LLEQLGEQDTLGFTGSATTALALRTHPVVAARAVTFNAEADSLNSSILGTDVRPDDPEFDLFVDQLVTEMTIKAGQKCTAIRRTFVPAAVADQVADAITDRLSTVVVGNPANENVQLGALASLAQREEVRRAITALTTTTRIVFGDPGKVDVLDADPERGAFLSPVLLRSDDLFAAPVHQIEAFGPVSTLLPYRDHDELAHAVALGEGSLVGSIVTRDLETAHQLITRLAPWHGRLLVLNRDDAAESTGHGVAMPQMLHGGPGRAGGGEELGGMRAVQHYLQRTAIQAHPDWLSGLLR